MIRLIKCLIILMVLSDSTGFAAVLNNRLNTAFTTGRFVVPSTAELKQFRTAFDAELSGKSVEDVWQTLAMGRIVNNELLFFQELEAQRKGRGLFAIRNHKSARPWLIQAPHSKADRYTGNIAAHFFAEHPIKAVMWNSVPRKTLIDGSPMPKQADMAHLHDTYWQVATEVFARKYRSGRIIQLHGFSQSKRKSVAGKQSDMIVSAGHHYPPFWIQAVARCLQQSLPGKISLYPYDVRELGATTNVQNHLLRTLGFGGFLHIEMSHSLRKQLNKNKKLRQTLVQCIQ